jgi:carbon monoxide dehydrogenase subunit G
MKFQNQIEIHKPIDEVFAFVAEMRNNPRWNYYVTEVVQEQGSGPAVGAQYFQTRKSDSQHYVMTQFDQGRSLTVETQAGSTPVFTRQMQFEPTASGTRITDQWTLQTAYPGFMEKLATGKIRGAVAENLGKLKELLERGQTQLQDGRLSQLT